MDGLGLRSGWVRFEKVHLRWMAIPFVESSPVEAGPR
jgi:hypothetical protein